MKANNKERAAAKVLRGRRPKAVSFVKAGVKLEAGTYYLELTLGDKNEKVWFPVKGITELAIKELRFVKVNGSDSPRARPCSEKAKAVPSTSRP